MQSVGLLEVGGYASGLVVLDDLCKTANVEVIQAELNDLLGICIRVGGPISDVEVALESAGWTAERLGVTYVTHVIPSPAAAAAAAIFAEPEYTPLMETDVVFFPTGGAGPSPSGKEPDVNPDASFAIGLIETQGYTAVIEAIDTACKTAAVEVVGREKLGGGYITVIIKGDVAAVRAAVEAGQAKVESLGKLIAAHVIPRPSDSVWKLLPQEKSPKA